MLLKILPYTTYKFDLSHGSAKHIMSILLILWYNGNSVTWIVVHLANAELKPLIFSMSAFALSYAAHMFILMTLYDFCLLFAQFSFVITYIKKFESYV